MRTLCDSNQSIPIRMSYDPKGNTFKSTKVFLSFIPISQLGIYSYIFIFVPVANCTNQDLGFLSFLDYIFLLKMGLCNSNLFLGLLG
jgi:hypothetical protein